jgi:hypothetical protein
MARTNTLQVFRSAHATYDADTDPSGLNYGELGWNNGGAKLFIGQQTTTGTPGTVVKFQINPAASATVAGLVELATDEEANTGTDATRALTPDNLGAWTGSTVITSVGDIENGTWSAEDIAADYLPDASTSAEGIVELATDAETATGTDTARALTASNLTAWATDTTTTIGAGKLPAATATAVGAIELAIETEVEAGTDTTRAVTPINLKKWAEDTTVAIVAGKLPSLDAITSPAADVSMTTGSTAYKITGLAAPTSPNDAARKADVDAAVQGLDVHDSVRVISVVDLPAGNIASNSGAYTIDSVPLVATDRVLLQNQTPPSENGIYVVNTPSGSTHSMTRAADANHADDLSANMFFFVEEGTVYKDTGWVCTTNETLTLANMVFAQFSGTGSYTAGDGLDLTGTEFGIADEGVTLARMANMATTSILGRKTASAGVPEVLSASDAGIVLGLGGAALLDVGTDTDEVCAGDDDRLSDSRTPTTHSHGVGHGGTGLNTLLDGAVMLGNGVNAITMLAKVAAGQLLTSGGTAAGDEAAWSDSLSGITIDCGTF